MADYTIKANLQVTDDGSTTQKRTQETQRLNAELDKLESSNKRRSAAAAKAENTDYNAARAVGGGTGAAGRDFGKEARAIGGLIGLYATYAATVFAVEAAFRKLKDAVDVENMTKGMDQLAAKSGVALGALSRQFVEATGSAISMKEGIDAVAKASSAGLNNTQILNIATGAQKAAAALGRDLPDSITRLTRGIAKLQPELLDELGLYSRLGPAVDQYAASIGKSSHQLTEAQRVQAFSIKVLKELNEKYGDITVDVNPYDKLLATLTNLTQTGLNFINIFLKPLASILSESPIALTGALLLLAKTVFEKFIPVMSDMREASRQEAEHLAQIAKAKSDAANAAFKQQGLIRAEELKAANDRLADLHTEMLAQEAIKNKASREGWSERAKLIAHEKTDINDLHEEDLKYLESKKGKSQEVLADQRATAAAIRALRDIDKQEQMQLEQINKQKPGFGSPAYMLDRDAQGAAKKALQKGIVANTLETAGTEGFIKAMQKMMKQIEDEKLGFFRGTMTGITGAIGAAAVRLAQFANVIGGALMVVGVAIGVFQLLGLMFNKATLELELFDKALKNAKETASTATSVFKKYGDSITVDSLLAKTKAINNIAASLEELPRSQEKAADKMSNFEKLFDNFAPKWMGGDTVGRLSDELSNGFQEAIKLAIGEDTKKKFEDSARELLGISGDLTNQEVSKRLAQGTPRIRQAFADLIKELGKETEVGTMPIQKLKEGWQSLERAAQDLRNSFISSDPGTKYGLELINQLGAMDDAFNNPINKLATLRDLAKDMSKINLLPADTQGDLRAAALEMQNLERQLKAAEDDVAKAKDKRDQLGSIGQAPANVRRDGSYARQMAARTMSGEAQATTLIRLEADNELKRATDNLDSIRKAQSALADNMKVNLSSGMQTAIKYLEGPLVRAMQEANINTQKALLAVLPKSAQIIDAQTKLEIESINIRKNEVSALRALVDALDLKRYSDEKLQLEKDIANPELAGKKEVNTKRLTEVENLLDIANKKATNQSLADKGQLTPEAAKALAERTGWMSQLVALENQKLTQAIKGEIEKVNLKTAQDTEDYNNKLKETQATNKQYLSSAEFGALSPAEKLAAQARLAEEERRQQNIIDLQPLTGQTNVIKRVQQIAANPNKELNLKELGISQLSSAQVKALQGIGSLAGGDQARIDVLIKSAEKVQKISAETLRNETARALAAENYLEETKAQFQIDDAAAKTRLEVIQKNKDDNALQRQILDNKERIGEIDQFDKANRINALDISDAQLESDKSKLESLTKFRSEFSKLTYDRIKDGTINSVQAQQEFSDLLRNYGFEGDQISQIFAATKLLADYKKQTSSEENKRLEAYNAVFEKGIDSATDKFMEFITTGKTSFKGLIDDMIAGLIRYELKQQMMKIYSGEGGIGGASGIVGAAKSAGSSILDFGKSLFGSAQGSAWDQGVMKYAMGGIVTQPTLFKFAQGTGMMGEAGPEAIMPLRRDGAGNLGVINGNGGGKVDVVVNNYSNQQATTKESMDAKGNRKIEVIVGDMVADQLSKTGSSAQQSLSSNYGNRPALVRR
jgi:lambda family phage tail tape measure protein